MTEFEQAQVDSMEAYLKAQRKWSGQQMAASKAQSAIDVTNFAVNSTTKFSTVAQLAEAFNNAQTHKCAAPLNSVKRAVVLYYKVQLKTKVLYTKLTLANYSTFLAYVNK